jgi:hypothetical protein
VKQFRAFTCYYCNARIVSKGSAHNAKCPITDSNSAVRNGPAANPRSVNPPVGLSVPSEKRTCDCGGAKTTGTHYEWCSTAVPPCHKAG